MSAGRRLAPIAAAGLVLLGCAAGPASASSASAATSAGPFGTLLLTRTSAAAPGAGATASAAPTGATPTARTTGGALVPGGTPTPGATPRPGGTPTPAGSAAAAPTSPAPTPTRSPGTLHPVSVGGVLFVSGVTTTVHPSWDPLGGRLHVEMTVRNATDQVIDASASLGATTLLGVDLGASDSIAVRGLAPGEVRTIGADIGGVGQWGVLKAHMTLTPPAQLRGVELAPLVRERWVLAPPWYAIGLVVAAGVVVRVLRRYRLGLVPRRLRNGRTRPWEPGTSSFPVVVP